MSLHRSFHLPETRYHKTNLIHNIWNVEINLLLKVISCANGNLCNGNGQCHGNGNGQGHGNGNGQCKGITFKIGLYLWIKLLGKLLKVLYLIMKHDYTILDTPCDEGWTEYTETGTKK